MTSARDVLIRDAAEQDVAALAELLPQLGYPADATAIRRRLSRLAAHPGTAVFVAEAERRVVGFATFHLMPVVHEDAPRGQLTALVVEERARGRGIGAALVRHVEAHAARCGVERFVVTTAIHRDATHRFYERLGYEWTGRRYATKLALHHGAGSIVRHPS